MIFNINKDYFHIETTIIMHKELTLNKDIAFVNDFLPAQQRLPLF